MITRRDTLATAAAAAAVPSAAGAQAPPDARPAPKGFLWGTAISAHQSEGNNVNSDSWLNEHSKPTVFREPSGDACDSYERYGEDVALAAGLGFNCHRFGIEWARIEPEPGAFSEAALDHYVRVLEACQAHRLAPVVTFNHFTTPRWFAARGGFEAADGPDLFARFCERAGRRLGPLIALATTFNEANAPQLLPVMVPAYKAARPVVKAMLAASGRASGSDRWSSWIFADGDAVEAPMLKAHALGYAALKAGPGRFPVGVSLSMQDIQAGPGGESLVAPVRQRLYGPWLSASNPYDFVGVQTYTRVRVGPEGVALPPPAGAELTAAGYEYDPAALGAVIRYTAGRTSKPIYVTESGIATDDDRRRIAFVDAALVQVRACLAQGIDVRGYLYWSLLDNYEWSAGYAQHFGLIAVDRTTFVRTPKPSAGWLGRRARSNRI